MSYSFDIRRKNSRLITRRMTPMQEAANMPLDLMCHDGERKPGEREREMDVLVGVVELK